LLPAWDEPAPLTAGTDAAGSEQRALAARKDLQAQEAWLRASRARIRGARSAFQPQVGVVASDTWYDSNAALDNKSQSIMGVVSMNLFSGGRDWHQLSAAQHDTDEGEQRLDGMKQAARADVRAAVSRLDEARARRAIAASSVDKARENVRLVKQRYGEGRTILIDLLMAERVLVEARHEELNAALAQELGVAQLALAEGRFALPGETSAP
jgi:outer membrane protein TolC